jgi:hypothetical protein
MNKIIYLESHFYSPVDGSLFVGLSLALFAITIIEKEKKD